MEYGVHACVCDQSLMRHYLQRPSEKRATKAYRVRVIRHINSKTLQKTTYTLQWRTILGTLSNLALAVMTLCYWSENPENHATWHDSLLLVDWRNVAAIFVQVDRYWERIVQVGQQFCRGHRFSSDVAKHAPSTRHTLQTPAETAWPATITTTTDAIFVFFCLTTFPQLLQNGTFWDKGFLQAGCPACGQLLLMGKKNGHYPFLLSFIISLINWQHLSTLRAFRFNGSHMPTRKTWHLLQHQSSLI